MRESRQAIIDKAYELGKQFELENGDCAQCALAAVLEALEMEDDGLFRAATGLADGLGLSANGHCGALSGAAMAIGYLFGRKKEDFSNMRKILKSNILSKKLHDWYVEKYGTIRCMDVQKKLVGRFYNMYDPAEFEQAVKDGFFNVSSSVVGEVAQMATRIILEEQERMAEKEKA